MDPGLIQVFKKYVPLGIIKGNDLLLPPKLAISFVEELSQIGILITGYDVWKYVNREHHPSWIVNLLGAGKYLGDEELNADSIDAGKSGEIFKKAILEHLPPDAEFVSLIFLDEGIYDFFEGLSKYHI